MRLQYDRYVLGQGVSKIKTRAMLIMSAVVLTVGSGGAAMISMLGSANAATPVVVYNNIESPQPANVPSVGFEATSTSEFGGQVGLAGMARKNPNVTVLMSSWACEDGSWTSGCVTSEGATFTHEVTLNVYAVNADNSPGTILATQTNNFTMPYRPSSITDGSHGCSNQKWYDAVSDTCNYGIAFPVNFSFNGLTFPEKVILGVAYNTKDYGSSPLGVSGPYDSLNVGTSTDPTIGTALPTNQDAYLNSTWNGAYCDVNTTDTGVFRLDSGCWGGYLPAFTITASPDETTPSTKDQCKKDGWKNFNSPSFKNQGQCVSFVERTKHL